MLLFVGWRLSSKALALFLVLQLASTNGPFPRSTGSSSGSGGIISSNGGSSHGVTEVQDGQVARPSGEPAPAFVAALPSGPPGITSGTGSMCTVCHELVAAIREDAGVRRRLTDALEGADPSTSQRMAFIHYLQTMLPSMTDDVFLTYSAAVSEYTSRCVRASRQGTQCQVQVTRPQQQVQSMGVGQPMNEDYSVDESLVDPSKVFVDSRVAQLQRVAPVHHGQDGNVTSRT